MKRFISILLVAILVVTCFATVAAAKEAKPGDTVEIEMSIEGEFANVVVAIAADNGLTITKVSGMSASVINSATSARANWASAGNAEEGVKTFKVTGYTTRFLCLDKIFQEEFVDRNNYCT